MKKILSMIITAIVIIGSIIALITSNRAMAESHSRKTCNEHWTGFVGPPPNASVAWNNNSCNHQLRVKIHCENPVSHFAVDEYGGWVRAIGLHSGQTCPANENHLLAAYAQTRNASGDPITTTRFF